MLPVRVVCRRCSRFTKAFNVKSLLRDKPLEERITISGRVRGARKMKFANFLDVDDGSSADRLQVLLDKNEDISDVTYHTGVTVTGILKKSTHPKQEVELHATELKVDGGVCSDPPYPFAPRHSYSPDYVRQYLDIRTRLESYAATMRIRDQLERSISCHMQSNGFIKVHTPILTSNNCEGGSDAFRVMTGEEVTSKDKVESFFKRDVFLTVSAQMHLEALANSLTTVYTLNQTFRAEPSTGRSHLAEFLMLEAEEAYVEGEEGLHHLLSRVEQLVKCLLEECLELCLDDLKLHWKERKKHEDLVRRVLSTPFTVLTYQEAVDKLSSTGVKYGDDLTKQQELKLTEMTGGATFVTHWPMQLKPFYMARSNLQQNTVLGFDLLLPSVGECVGGSLRENSYETLCSNAPKGEALSWYLNLRKWGGVPTAGYGLGFERLLLFVTGVENIKDVIAFPRSVDQCSC